MRIFNELMNVDYLMNINEVEEQREDYIVIIP